MAFLGDDRGQVISIAAVLLFAIVVIAFSVYQATAIPQQNAATEYEHSQHVQQDFRQLRDGLVQTIRAGEPLPEAVRLGTRYRQRMIGVNPGPVSGSLRTSEPHRIEVYADGGAAELSDEVCPGSDPPTTRLLEYRASYNNYPDAPTLVYENTVAHKQFVDPSPALSRDTLTDRTIPMTGQVLVRNQQINLLPLTGNYSVSTVGTTTVEANAGPTRATAVQNPTIVVPTRMSPSEWKTLLDRSGVDYDAVTVDARTEYDPVGRVNITLPETYTVQCTGLAVGDAVPPGTAGTVEQANLVKYVAGSISEPQNGELTFDIENDGTEEVSITGFSVSVPEAETLSATDPDPEFYVDSSPRVAVGNRSATQGYDADGTLYSLSGILGDASQDGVMDRGTRATVTLKTFKSGGNAVKIDDSKNKPFESVSGPNAGPEIDVSVTLHFSDGSGKTFYFTDNTKADESRGGGPPGGGGPPDGGGGG